ncbi:hypothetical protein IPA_07515 [Ignicoccus pacificus DSM 13166]|uniref:Uncharacterized protein n=1 Tax=Ignicoccus pacificus DSM 13166 TaxID=940294 RepID=A0A977KBR2_9CREN|nr:hypothetical protein IPA_07515 [Ignicoccus pacificus DSM 13166]
MICVNGPISFSELMRLSDLKRSTLWDCLEKMEKEELIEMKKVLTLTGPRTIAKCKEEGLEALEELEDMLGELRNTLSR